MNMKSYILPEKNVGTLAQTVAVQQGKLTLQKDEESSFYIAEISEDIILPQNIQALEFQMPSSKEKTHQLADLPKELLNETPNAVDLLIRLQFEEEPSKEKIPLIYKEISKAIEGAMKKFKGPSSGE